MHVYAHYPHAAPALRNLFGVLRTFLKKSSKLKFKAEPQENQLSLLTGAFVRSRIKCYSYYSMRRQNAAEKTKRIRENCGMNDKPTLTTSEEAVEKRVGASAEPLDITDVMDVNTGTDINIDMDMEIDIDSDMDIMIEITKAHGLGNDFLIVDNRDRAIENPWALARRLCKRRTGIGADGLILIEPSNVADVTMRIINSDGSEAQMCGNGIRCFARYVYEHGIVSSKSIRVETLAGIMVPEVILNDDSIMAVRVNMGRAEFDCKRVPMYCGKRRFVNERISAAGKTFQGTVVLMGVPHLVLYVTAEPSAEEIALYGGALERHGAFPEGTNVDFVQLEDGRINLWTWERGCGATLACGTGACAAAAAMSECGTIPKLGLIGAGEARIKLPLGELIIEEDADKNLFMTGPCEEVFTGRTSRLSPLERIL